MTQEVLKLALEALETGGWNKTTAAITAIKEALAQPPEERNFCPRCGKRAGKNDWDVHTCSLPEPEQEPVACVQDLDEVKRKHLVYEKGMDWKDPLYTTPPQRKPLTDGWILGMWPDTGFPLQVIKFARAIEAAHGITGEKT